MANLSEVQSALKQGDRQKAAQILKTLLKERPSADAWVMAARMTNNPDTARQHLQRALALEPKHVKARDMLRDLGGQQKSVSGNLMEEVVIGLEDFGKDTRILSKFAPKQRMMIAIGLFGMIFLAMIVLVVNLLRPVETPPPPVMGTPVPSFTVAGDALISHLTASGLSLESIQKVEPEANLPISEQIALTVLDAAGSRNATIYLYADLDGLFNDRERLADLTKNGSNVIIYQTAALVYPADLESSAATALETAFNSAPVS
ncbi:MAG: tetratricopeptide repeat protein [Anaerolineae bacterium]|nr:tetratricopeptide repeat protein [Anaerolineae bacterium]